MGQRRRYTEEYRHDAASLVLDTGHTITAVAKQLDLGEQLLGNWVKKERIRRASTDNGEPSLEKAAAEIARPRREVADLKAENEFLGKASGINAAIQQDCQRFELMEQEKANYAVTMMARVLEVSRSGFLRLVQAPEYSRSAPCAPTRPGPAGPLFL